MNIADQLKAVTKKAADAEKAMRRELQSSFNDAAQAFFEKAPEGTTLMWAQYTDYFNDGDPCTFSVYSVVVRGVRDWTEEERKDWGDEDLESYHYDEVCQRDAFSGEIEKDYLALSDFIERQDDLMQKLYGDHVLVKMTKAGAEVESWEHD